MIEINGSLSTKNLGPYQLLRNVSTFPTSWIIIDICLTFIKHTSLTSSDVTYTSLVWTCSYFPSMWSGVEFPDHSHTNIVAHWQDLNRHYSEKFGVSLHSMHIPAQNDYSLHHHKKMSMKWVVFSKKWWEMVVRNCEKAYPIKSCFIQLIHARYEGYL